MSSADVTAILGCIQGFPSHHGHAILGGVGTAWKDVKLLLNLGEEEGKVMDIPGKVEGYRHYFGSEQPAESTDHQTLRSITAEVSF